MLMSGRIPSSQRCNTGWRSRLAGSLPPNVIRKSIMPTYYKGASIGTYWHTNDASVTGLYAVRPGAGVFVGGAISHILTNSAVSPYISLTKSYEIALNYALLTGVAGQIPTRGNPAFVYEVFFDATLPPGVQLFDPVETIVSATARAAFGMYQHDGGPDYLLGIINSRRFGKTLLRPRITPSGPDITSPILTPELKSIVRSLRDAELIATGVIPVANIRRLAVTP